LYVILLIITTIIVVGVDNMNLNGLGRRIKRERLKRGITQEQLAEKVDISVNFMSLIENGRNMSVETLANIAVALGVTVDYLLSDTVNVGTDVISEQIVHNLATLNEDEKLYFLNMIKQYKAINR
jgi:transcriptional regulator with XRE-family HTH domain